MMKRNLFTLAVAMFISCAVYATGINRQQAAQLARDYMSKNFSEKSAARRTAGTISLHEVETGQSLVYAFNIEGGGFVVVAGDDCAPAILGFSEKSVIDPQDIPDGMKYLFEQYQQDMQFMIQNGLQASETATLGEEVKPLMASKWGQGAPYNYMSPKYKKTRPLRRVWQDVSPWRWLRSCITISILLRSTRYRGLTTIRVRVRWYPSRRSPVRRWSGTRCCPRMVHAMT